MIFNDPLLVGYTCDNVGRAGSVIHNLSLEEQKERRYNNRLVTLKKSATAIWRIVNANLGKYRYLDKFITLTFRKSIDEISLADYEVKKFIQKLRRHTGERIQYIGTRELQARGAIHYHLCLFGMPYVKYRDLLKIWVKNNPYMDPEKPSGVNIKGIVQGLQEISNYLTSYQVKDLLFQDDDFLQGHYTLVKSNGLIMPDVVDYENIVLLPGIDEIKKAVSFIDNKITYYRIN